MADSHLAVVPFGSRWTIERNGRRLSIHDTFDAAMTAVTRAAHQATDVGEQAAILVRERDGVWREFVYSHAPDYIVRPTRMQSRPR